MSANVTKAMPLSRFKVRYEMPIIMPEWVPLRLTRTLSYSRRSTARRSGDMPTWTSSNLLDLMDPPERPRARLRVVK